MVTLFYPAQLDTVRFTDVEDDEVLAQRSLRATADIMLELVDGRRLPVFSAGQVFDGAAILGTVGANDKDATAFLNLISESRVQMKILPSLVRAQKSEDDTFSLVNAFVSAIDRNFTFSAWPELSDRDARVAVAALLRGASKTPIGGELGSRLDALQRLDRAFRESEASERAVESSWNLEAMVAERCSQQDTLAYLRHHHAEVVALNNRRSVPLDLRNRTGWYQLLDEYLTQFHLPPGHGQVRSLRRMVDIQYNRKLAKSLGAAVSREEEDRPDVMGVLDDASMSNLRREAGLLLSSDARNDWFSWSTLHARLGPAKYQARVESPDARRARFDDLIRDGHLARIDQSSVMLFVRHTTKGLAGIASKAPASLIGSAIALGAGGGTVSVATGAVVGAFLGGVLSDAVDDTVMNDAVRNFSLKGHLRGIQKATTADVEVEAGRPSPRRGGRDA